ncbi:MAG: hypothetical protein ACRDSN_21240 [Pseudonocardiaceae bacterium]
MAEAAPSAGLPAVTGEYLEGAFGDEQWAAAEAAVEGLIDRFAAARFAD